MVCGNFFLYQCKEVRSTNLSGNVIGRQFAEKKIIAQARIIELLKRMQRWEIFNMSYFMIENEELVQVQTEKLPVELEKLYQQVRKMYIIQYNCWDWANDTSDNGMGYDYDNSYEVFREPERREMIVRDDELIGFYVGFSNNIQLENKATEKYFLKLENGAEIHHGTSSTRYGNSKTWVLHIKEEAVQSEDICLLWVEAEDKEHIFTPEEFDCKYIDSVLGKSKWENSNGYFDGAFRVTLKLTREGAENPDAVLQELQKYRPILVTTQLNCAK